jgi:hypothetical protein
VRNTASQVAQHDLVDSQGATVHPPLLCCNSTSCHMGNTALWVCTTQWDHSCRASQTSLKKVVAAQAARVGLVHLQRHCSTHSAVGCCVCRTLIAVRRNTCHTPPFFTLRVLPSSPFLCLLGRRPRKSRLLRTLPLNNHTSGMHNAVSGQPSTMKATTVIR